MKIKQILILFIVCMGLLPQTILAGDPEYNGSGSGGYADGGGDFVPSSKWSSRSNSITVVLKVSLLYYDKNGNNGKGSLTRDAHDSEPFYITNNAPELKKIIDSFDVKPNDSEEIKKKKRLKLWAPSPADNVLVFSNMTSGKSYSNCGIINCDINIGKLEQYFTDVKNYTDQNGILERFGLTVDAFNDIYADSWGNVSGYRILIEPCFMAGKVDGNGNQENKILSLRQWSRKSTSVLDFSNWDQKAKIMYLSFDDMYFKISGLPQITGDNAKEYLSRDVERTGYGMHLVLMPPLTQCYTDEVIKTSGDLTCKDNGTHASATYTQTFTSRVCAASENPGISANTKYGINVLAGKTKYGKEVGKRCIAACKETVAASLPGSIQGAINVKNGDSYFEWPTIQKNTLYDAKVQGTKSCTIILESQASDTVTNNCIEYVKKLEKSNVATKLYGDFNNQITLSYVNGEYNFKELALKETNQETTSTYVKPNNITAQKLKEGITFTITKSSNLSLPDTGTYKYVNKLTGKLSTTPFSTKYDTLPSGVLAVAQSSIRKNQATGASDSFDMILKGKIGAFKQDIGNYTCQYKLTEDSSDCGTCPAGTKNEGEPLNNTCGIDLDKLKSEKTSAESVCTALKETICNISKDQWQNNGYDPNKVCCPAPNSATDITDCINNGGSYEQCSINAGCIATPTPSVMKCPPGTKNCGLDITECVKTNMKFGMTEAQAKAKCTTNLCNGPSGGGLIIYRTINLNNPFPSKELNSNISWTNYDINSGRRPGANWNNQNVVTKKILNNRGVKGEAVYNKTPLYTIVLDANKIRKIRAYNKNHQYDDFTLNCKNGAKCRSNFIRSSDSGNALTGGTCTNISFDDFDACYNRG